MQHPVRKVRTERKLSLEQAAAQLKTSKGNLSRIETGVHGASDPLKLRIIEWSGGEISFGDLVGPVRAPEAAA